METIGIVVIVMAAVASRTKLIDVVTTIRGVKRQAGFIGANRAISLESNPIGRIIFRRFGVVGGCWVTFVVWTLICMVSALEVVFYDIFALSIGVIAFYCLLTYLNVWTGIYNMTGRMDPLTRSIGKFYCWLGRKLGVH